MNHHLSTSSHTINILSYTVLNGDASYEKLSLKLEEAEMQGLIMVNVEIIVGIPFLINAIILGIQNILEVLLEDIGILKMESIFLHTNVTNTPHSVLYVSLSYYIINPCTSASSNFDDSFS
ncbi:HN1_G0053100.mRNA.1.CDS.1 [Saccharomyces cerevisiae]|nr:HN1_G0053100.mRNA.1.CDS.1 [Saccharomyces cerevisiae]